MSAVIVAATGFAAEERQTSMPKIQLTLDGRVSSSSPRTCHSRSTSAGSATPPQSSAGEENGRSPILSLAKALEDPFENMGKTPFVIRNTFYDAPVDRPVSLEGFFSERAVHSCPPSRLMSFDDVKAPPGLEDVGSGKVDKSIRAIAPVEPDPFFVIRNTFIDTAMQRPMSLEGFFTEREAQSCPATRPSSIDDAQLPAGIASLLESMNEACPLTAPARTISLDDATLGDPSVGGCGSYGAESVGIPSVPPPPVGWAPVFSPSACSPPPPPPAFSPDARVLRLSQILEEPPVTSANVPSIGSSGHHVGNCKPCAFFHTKGCGNGMACSFCHLCGPEEKKKRRAEKRVARCSMGQPGLAHP